ncbi:MAG: DUF4236 domain-containing protein [uncultured Clostridium sp.]
MGFSWRKSIKLGKNLRLNLLSGSGLGLSFGVKNARASVNKNGVRLSGGKGRLRLTKHFSFKKIFKFLK